MFGIKECYLGVYADMTGIGKIKNIWKSPWGNLNCRWYKTDYSGIDMLSNDGLLKEPVNNVHYSLVFYCMLHLICILTLVYIKRFLYISYDMRSNFKLR